MQPAWFSLSEEQRGELVQSHKAILAEFPEVEVNVSRSFGLGDQEWVFGCEVHNLARYEELNRKLRGSPFNEFVLIDSPALLGTCVSAHEALELCGAL
jgi:chlorite dismutase